MLRVCGVTYTFSTNYGTCLQAYALQTAIEKIRIGGERCSYQLIPIGRCPGYPKANAKTLKARVKRIVIKHTRKPFKPFEDKYMEYTSVYSIENLKELNNDKDVFVCGSDIVWNPEYNRGLSAYYLDFAKKYKFSYAASFGKSNFSEEDFPEIGRRLSSFNAISVREKKSEEIAQKSIDRDISVVVDPVLLLEKDEWSQIAEKDNKNVRYIFVYAVGMSKTLKAFVQKLREQTSLPVVWSAGNPKAVIEQGKLQVQTPQRWLQLIRDAEYVVTDSFHGTAFSVLFQRNVFTVVKGKVDEGFNIRMNDFLNSVGLSQRIFNAVPEKIDCKAPDYSIVDSNLEKMKAHSLAFLRENLEAAYQEKLKLEQKEQ